MILRSSRDLANLILLKTKKQKIFSKFERGRWTLYQKLQHSDLQSALVDGEMASRCRNKVSLLCSIFKDSLLDGTSVALHIGVHVNFKFSIGFVVSTDSNWPLCLPFLTETGSEDDGLLDLSSDDFFESGSSSDDADDELTDKSTRYWFVLKNY